MYTIDTLRLEITQQCPLACGHCSVSAGLRRTQKMDHTVACKLIKEFKDQGGQSLIVTGGEPLLHESLHSILECSKVCGLNTILFSMGVLFDSSYRLVPIDSSRALEMKNWVDLCRVSLHSGLAARHDALTRIQGSFEATCLAVKNMVKAGINVTCTFFAYPGNLTDLLQAATLCDELGIHELRILTSVPQGRAATKGDSLFCAFRATQRAYRYDR